MIDTLFYHEYTRCACVYSRADGRLVGVSKGSEDGRMRIAGCTIDGPRGYSGLDPMRWC